MLRRLAVFLLAIHILSGSIMLPLGDFALLKDLPKMYQAYEKIAAPDEKGWADFIGDYLLNGKVLLGHNKKDLPEKSGNLVQFRQASALLALPESPDISIVLAFADFCPLFFSYQQANTTYFPASLFRPPLAIA